MALLNKCCCGYTLRQGSFGAGSYTLVYFVIFALLTGNYSYHEVMSRYSSSNNANANSNATPTLTPTSHNKTGHHHHPINSTLPVRNNATNAKTVQKSNATDFHPHPHQHQDQSQPHPPSPMPISEILLVAVDFVCEICGLVASILLLRGLQCDRQGYLIPWLVVVPLHTLIDTFTVINIIILYVEHISQPPPLQALDAEQAAAVKWWGLVTALTVVVDLILNSVNVYVFLIVLSQYQEYLAGRGSAAYESYHWQEQASAVRYDAGSGGGGDQGRGGGGGQASKSKGKRPNGNNPCFSDADKSCDLWCDDLVLDKLDMSRSGAVGEDDDDDDEEWEENGGRRKGQSRKISNITTTTTTGVVRFDGDENKAGQASSSSPLLTEEPRVTVLQIRKS